MFSNKKELARNKKRGMSDSCFFYCLNIVAHINYVSKKENCQKCGLDDFSPNYRI